MPTRRLSPPSENQSQFYKLQNQVRAGATVPEVSEGKMDYFMYRSKPNLDLRARGKQLKQWREQILAEVVV